MDGTTSLGNATINAGKATLAKSSLSVGAHSITAGYNGNTKFSPSTSNAVAENVNRAATTSTLATTPNPSAFGQAVKLTATVKSGTAKVVGTVTFMNGMQTLGTATLSLKGVANLSVGSLAAGSNSLTAVYAGNGNFLGSTSAVVHQTVNKAATTTTLKSGPNPAVQGKTVTFTATIKPAFPGTPSGSVIFKDGGTVIGTAPVNASRQGQITNSTLSKGNHNITAAYGGDSSYSGSASSVVAQVIN